MAGIKETFSKGLTTLNVKTNLFMESNTIKTRINTLDSECKTLYAKIGETLYQQWTNGSTDVSAMESDLEQIKKNQEQIAEEKANLEELKKQEEDILGKKSAEAQEQQAAEAPTGDSQIFCSQCGAPNSSSFKFCSKCGSALVK